ncbi:MAG: efflux RND transporter periplasmic adaptor subunit [Porphyromonadaceae bacterium]|nr:efflux RND transporter periplasmic adaptor subunit [Porphyromonadaceae bacterium]
MRTVIVSLFATVALLLLGCRNENHEKKVSHDATEHADGELHEHSTANVHTDEIHFSKARAKAVGLTLETVSTGTFRQVIKTSGQILSSQGDETTITSTANGVVSFTNGSIVPGTTVRAGERVVTVSVQKLPEGDPVVKAKIAYETAQKAFQRAEKLEKEQIISARDFEEARSRYETAKNSYESMAFGYSAGSISITSPMGGFVKKLFVGQGDYVSVGQPIATVSQNRRLQLRAEVPETYYKTIPTIQSANFKMAYDDRLYELSTLHGSLLSFGKSLDGNSFFIPVTFEFDNVDGIIPGSYIDVFLLSSPLENILSVPVSAITEEQGLYFVYVQLDEEGYKKQEITFGQSDGARVQVLTGLKQGDKIVTHGVYQVKLAATSSVIPEGHTH